MLLRHDGTAAARDRRGGRGAAVGQRLFVGASAAGIAHLESRVERSKYELGALIVRCGEPADAEYFLMRGDVSVIVERSPGGHQRLSTLSTDVGCREVALVPGGLRSADVRADALVECCGLGVAAFARLEHTSGRR